MLARMRLKYVLQDKDANGNPRVYVRRHGRKVRIQEEPGTPEFARAVAAALEKLKDPVPYVQPQRRDTFSSLADRYFDSVEFKALDPISQRTRRGVIGHCLRERMNDAPMHVCLLPQFGPDKIIFLRDQKADKPGAANHRLQYLSAMFQWAVKHSIVKVNPCRDVERLRIASGGFHSWTVAEVEKFEARWPIGTKQRLAMALMLYLGVRRGDVVRLSPEMVRDGVLSFTPAKTAYKRAALSHKPILPALAEIIAASPIGKTTYLETAFGVPYTRAGFGNWFRVQCDLAGLPHCTAHGLRKAGATIAANLGATAHALMALYDWSSPQQAEPYTRAADRAKLARGAANLIAGRHYDFG